MENLAPIIGENLASLRKRRGLTQGEISERFHYTDKAISKWEHGEAMPDINTLAELAEFYGVTVNDLLTKHDEESDLTAISKDRSLNPWMRHFLTYLLGIVMVWTFATMLFIACYGGWILNGARWNPFMAFIWSVPASVLIAMIFNVRWGNRTVGFWISLAFVLTLITAIYLEIAFDVDNGWQYWYFLFLAIPLSLFVVFYFYSRKK